MAGLSEDAKVSSFENDGHKTCEASKSANNAEASLQELIECELAFRMSPSATLVAADDTLNVSATNTNGIDSFTLSEIRPVPKPDAGSAGALNGFEKYFLANATTNGKLNGVDSLDDVVAADSLETYDSVACEGSVGTSRSEGKYNGLLRTCEETIKYEETTTSQSKREETLSGSNSEEMERNGVMESRYEEEKIVSESEETYKIYGESTSQFLREEINRNGSPMLEELRKDSRSLKTREETKTTSECITNQQSVCTFNEKRGVDPSACFVNFTNSDSLPYSDLADESLPLDDEKEISSSDETFHNVKSAVFEEDSSKGNHLDSPTSIRSIDAYSTESLSEALELSRSKGVEQATYTVEHPVDAKLKNEGGSSSKSEDESIEVGVTSENFSDELGTNDSSDKVFDEHVTTGGGDLVEIVEDVGKSASVLADEKIITVAEDVFLSEDGHPKKVVTIVEDFDESNNIPEGNVDEDLGDVAKDISEDIAKTDADIGSATEDVPEQMIEVIEFSDSEKLKSEASVSEYSMELTDEKSASSATTDDLSRGSLGEHYQNIDYSGAIAKANLSKNLLATTESLSTTETTSGNCANQNSANQNGANQNGAESLTRAENAQDNRGREIKSSLRDYYWSADSITSIGVSVKKVSPATNCLSNCTNEVSSETVTKKTVKKKKSSSEEISVGTTNGKVKKTKKTKKHEEKENVSVTLENGYTNGHDDSFHQILDEMDELSNVCVRNLKLTYVHEANKDISNKCLFSEEPVPASIPIKELRRSFGDLRDAGNEKQDIFLKSSCGKFDELSKKAMIHVRSGDSTRAQQTAKNQNETTTTESICKSCSKTVFAMELIKAERQAWHKNCFRCTTCNKQLTVDIYSSHEGQLYCKPHFRDLFKPKAVVEDDDAVKVRKKPELIIRENEPVPLSPDVVRACDKPDLGLEELNSLNVKSRFQMFENGCNSEEGDNQEKEPVTVKRSPSILSKVARFQAKGNKENGVPNDMLNGFDYEETESEQEEEEEASDEHDGVTKSKIVREKPIAFGNMDDVKKTWEGGEMARKEEHREERRKELQHIRSRLFMGKQVRMKEAYEQAVAESEKGITGNKKIEDLEVQAVTEKARAIKEKFERGEVLQNGHGDSDEETTNNAKGQIDEDLNVFENGISKTSRSLFKQLDANVAKNQQTLVKNHHQSTEHRKTRESSSPERDTCHNPDIVRCGEPLEDEEEIVKKSQTTAKMLSLFRQLEEAQETVSEEPKPLKCFTPPPEGYRSESSSEEDEEEDSSECQSDQGRDDVIKASYKVEDEYLKQASNAVRARTLKEKFERWQPEKQSNNNAIAQLDSEQASLDTTKSLRARFESLRANQPVEKSRPKVNRFVECSNDICDGCQSTVYSLEKVEASGKMFHKNCFKCSKCHCILRMDSFTINKGFLYCRTHFKQLFISKGNYDEGFGLDQHKDKWNNSAGSQTSVDVATDTTD